MFWKNFKRLRCGQLLHPNSNMHWLVFARRTQPKSEDVRRVRSKSKKNASDLKKSLGAINSLKRITKLPTKKTIENQSLKFPLTASFAFPVSHVQCCGYFRREGNPCFSFNCRALGFKMWVFSANNTCRVAKRARLFEIMAFLQKQTAQATPIWAHLTCPRGSMATGE